MVRELDPTSAKSVFAADLLTLSATRLFVTVRLRSAWQGTTSNIYQGPSSLEDTLARAKTVAEDWRAQGSYFYIHEVAALIVGTSVGPVACVDFHGAKPFTKWVDTNAEFTLKIGAPARHILKSLGRFGSWKSPVPSEHSFIQGKCYWVDYPEISESFSVHKSIARGGDYRLGWQTTDREQSLEGIESVLGAFSTVNDDVVRREAVASYDQARIERDNLLRKVHEARVLFEVSAGEDGSKYNVDSVEPQAVFREARSELDSRWYPTLHEMGPGERVHPDLAAYLARMGGAR